MTFDFWLSIFGIAPVGAVTSQTLLDLSIILLFAGWVFNFFSREPDQVRKLNWIGIEWAFLGYFVAVLLGFWLNASPDAEVAWQLKKFTWVAHLYLFIYAFQKMTLRPGELIKYFSYFFLLPNIYALVSYIIGYDPITKVDSPRILGLVSSATYHAHSNAVIFIFFSACLYFGFQKLSGKMKAFTIFCYVLFALSIFLTFTRGIWVSILLSTLTMYSLISYKKTLVLLLSVVFLGFGSYFIWPQFKARILHSMSAEKNHERADLLMVNYKIWTEYPLLGIGYGENARRNREYWDQLKMPDGYIESHAHNQFLNVMATTGVIGLFFFLYFFSFFLKKNWKLLRATDRMQTPYRYAILFACFGAQLEFILACLTDVSFEYAKIRALLIIVWALVVAIEMKPTMISEEKISAGV